MANKKTVYTFGGANQDMSKAKHTPQYYFEAQHINILSTNSQSTGAARNEKGNTSVISIPTVTINESLSRIEYGSKTLSYASNNELAGFTPLVSSTQVIIGHIETREGIVLWTTDNLGFDCIWYIPNILDNSYDLTLLYVRDFGFSTSNPIQAVFNYENVNIQKVYWVDGVNQLRYMNLTHDTIEDNTPLIDIPLNTINLVGNVDFSQPKITNIIGGGSHTSGMVQYGYNLSRLNGSQTKLSPLSDLVPLDKGPNLGGGSVNEVVSATPIIQINNIDTSYSIIRVYAVKYTSLNEIPSISLIEERDLGNNSSITVYDDGSTIQDVTLAEFTFLGSNPIIPKHIETKYSRLFLANIDEATLDLPRELDCRAYSFTQSATTTKVWEDPQLNAQGELNPALNWTTVNNTYSIPYDHSAINIEYKTRKYQYNSSVLGGEGKFIKYQLVQKTAGQLTQNPEEYRFLKDDELYRIGIEFYNNLGQTSQPKWIADFRAPEGNLEGNYNTLKVTLKSEFYTWLNTYPFENSGQIPTGYRILRANRTAADKTILCQGALTQFMVQTTDNVSEHEYWKVETNRRDESNVQIKMPIPVSRGFTSNIRPLNKTKHLEMMNELSDYYDSVNEGNGKYPNEEIYSGLERGWKTQQSWQYTKLWQMYSPEVMFNVNLAFGANLKFRVKGLVKNTNNSLWYKRILITTEEVELQEKKDNLTDFMWDPDIEFMALFGPSAEDDEMDFTLFNREYLTYIKAPFKLNFNVYGVPEVTERGQGVTSYNGNGSLRYQNTLQGFLTDTHGEDSSRYGAIYSMNSYGARCLTFAEGASSTDLYSRKSLEDLRTYAGFLPTQKDGLLLAEIVLSDAIVATGNVYGGNSYEDKARTNYIKIGDYTPIATTFVEINNGGDTYVYNYKCARISKTDTQVLDDQVLQVTEIIQFPVETEVDLKNRDDKSLFDWDNEFQPSYDSYFKYNTVYSQQPTLISNTSVDFKFKKVKGFDTRIQASKLKIPNESVDSWTDILENEFLDLDGKHGSINNIMVYKDTMFAFQDKAIATVAINPRVQVQGSDGIGIELGIGGVLYNFNYITTNSGSINKWGITAGKRGIYYYDALNRAVGRVPNETDVLLSDTKGMHSFFNTHYNYPLLKQDNPILGNGVVLGRDIYNSEIYITLLQGADSFTWRYNELVDGFIDLKTYKPSRYINNGEKLLIPSSGNKILWEQFSGNYNSFFGVTQPSYITLQLNPEPELPTTFDTIEFNSEAYLGSDLATQTYTHIQAYNEYQDSGLIALTNSRNGNLRRKFRLWKANIPRQNRNRMKNPWLNLKLQLQNPNNYEVILHDIMLNYTI